MLQDSSLLQQKCPCPDAVSQGLSHLFLFFLQLHPSPWTRAAPLPDKFKEKEISHGLLSCPGYTHWCMGRGHICSDFSVLQGQAGARIQLSQLLGRGQHHGLAQTSCPQ